MTTRSRIVASFLACSLGGTAALAQAAGNEARLDVSVSPGGSSVGMLTLTQTPNSNSRITQAPEASGDSTLLEFSKYADGTGNGLYPANGRGQIKGSYSSVSITQGPGANNLAINVIGRASSTTATVALNYTGDGNEHSLRTGAGAIAASTFLNATIAADVTGDDNDIRDNIRGGGAGVLAYDLDIDGNANDVRVFYGNRNGSALTYTVDIDGDNNDFTVRGGDLLNMSKTLTVTIDGSNNDVVYNGVGTLNASLTATFKGDDINADLFQQNADNQNAMLMVTNDMGASALDFTMSQQGFNQSVDATLTHLAGGAGAGSFSITQDAMTTGALYSGSTVLAGGGMGMVSQ